MSNIHAKLALTRFVFKSLRALQIIYLAKKQHMTQCEKILTMCICN